MNSQAGKIVVGYDGSEPAAAAVDWAATEAQRRGRPLTVLHVIDYSQAIPGPIRATPWPNVGEELIGQIAVEGAVRAGKHAATVEITPVAEHGHAAHTLLDASAGAELLVVGTRGHGTLAGAVLGSVSATVSAHARCPVVVVRGDSSLPPGPSRPVVVGVDDSSGADAALRFAAATAAQARARVIVLAAYQPDLLPRWTGIESTILESRPGHGYVAQALSVAERTVARAALTALELHPELDVIRQVQQGPASGVIAAATYRIGLVVVGCRGRGGFAELMLGSVSHRLLRTALCPVAVVPEVSGTMTKGKS